MKIRRLLLEIQNTLHSSKQTGQFRDVSMVGSKLIQFYIQSTLIILFGLMMVTQVAM